MKRRLVLGALAALVLAACTSSSSTPAVSPAPTAPTAAEKTRIDDDALSLFHEQGVEGAFVLADLSTGGRVIVGSKLVSRGFSPCSTFKIPNTLIGLDTGVIADEHFTLAWDGKRRDVDAWNRDHDLASAMKYSVVWYYQEVARRIGEERMRRYVSAFRYGNADISGGVDRFWLESTLRITPLEQIDFLSRMKARKLPVRAEHVDLVERITVLDAPDGAPPGLVLRGKTGLGEQDGRAIGWLVGFVERDREHVQAYATLIVGDDTTAKPDALKRLMPMRRELSVKLLRRFGAM
jgi:beta-lactamase class D